MKDPMIRPNMFPEDIIETAIKNGWAPALAILAEKLPLLFEKFYGSSVTPGPWNWCIGSGHNVGTGLRGTDPATGKSWMIADFYPDWFEKENLGILRKSGDHRDDMNLVLELFNALHEASLAQEASLQGSNK